MSLFALSADDARRIADLHGTPSFVYRLDVAGERFRLLQKSLPARVRLAYAIKANPHPALVGRFAELGASFDAASIGELSLLERLQVPGSRILFAGPGKSKQELECALRLGARIEIDGLEDAQRIDDFMMRSPRGTSYPVAAEVSLRVHPQRGVSEGSRIIGGAGPSAVGVDEENLSQFLNDVRTLARVNVRGLQVFAASNERDALRLAANHRVALSIARVLADEVGAELDLIDLGGGLGIPYSADETELDVAVLGESLAELLDANAWFRGDLLLEPGRWLAGPSGAYLTRVLRLKESRGTRFVILEGGINHLLRPLLTGQAFPVCAPGLHGGELVYTLTGPLCTSLDRLGEVLLPQLKSGDLLMFGQTGAYGFTEAMGTFLSHPLPAELIMEAPSGDLRV